jgi:hypothetical protein
MDAVRVCVSGHAYRGEGGLHAFCERVVRTREREREPTTYVSAPKDSSRVRVTIHPGPSLS